MSFAEQSCYLQLQQPCLWIGRIKIKYRAVAFVIHHQLIDATFDT